MSIIFARSRQMLMSAVTCSALACMPIATAQGASTPHPSASNTPSQAIIYTFAATTSPASVPPTLSDASCPSNTNRPPEGTARPVDPRLVETINKELTHRLSKKLPVAIAPADAAISPGTLVFAGCLTTINGGNAAERMVGFRLGSGSLAGIRCLGEGRKFASASWTGWRGHPRSKGNSTNAQRRCEEASRSDLEEVQGEQEEVFLVGDVLRVAQPRRGL
jgi:hypothetical protein